MNWILKNKNLPCRIAKNKNISQGKKIKALFAVLFLAFIFSFFVTSDAKAAQKICSGDFSIEDTIDSKGVFANGEFFCGCQKANDGGGCVGFSVKTKEECTAKATTVKDGTKYKSEYAQCYFKGATLPMQKANGGGDTAQTNPNITSGVNPKAIAEGVADAVDNEITRAIKWILVKVLALVGWLFAIASTLFAWAVNPANISAPATGILQKQAVKDVWIMVRDLLNMAFILVLLFSAFGTIFQLDKWNIKNVWLQILIQALLVNFSYPIARFIIDLSNVAFYYLLNNLFSSTGTTVVSGDSIFAMFGSSSGISNLLSPENYAKYDVSYLLAMIMVVFIMGMTLFVIAILFVVRLIALAMLVMFSPIGFVGYAVPSFSGYAKQWWGNLFSYSFFAPVMIFFMAVSLRVTQAVQGENFPSLLSGASANAPADQATWIANAALFAIPVIMLWMGMGIAKKFGIEFADKAVDWAKKGKGWVVNGAKWATYGNPVARGIKEGVKEKSRYNKFEKWWKSPSGIEAAVKGGIVNTGRKDGMIGGAVNAWNKTRNKTIADENKKKIAESIQDHIDTGKTADQLFAIMNDSTKSKLDQAAAAGAYQRLDFNDKRAHTMATLAAGSGTTPYGDHTEALQTVVHPAGSSLATEQAKAKSVADAIKMGGAVASALTKDDHAALAAYINKHAKAKQAEGVKTKA